MEVLEAIEQKTLDARIPFRATLELTYRCSFECVHCYCAREPGRRELTTTEWREAMDELADLGALSLTLTGGEPLLRQDFFPLARHARRRRFALRIFTNASLVGPREAEGIAALKPISVDVSLYGACAASYEAVTGRGENFQKTLRGVRELLSAGVKVILKMPVLRENAGDLENMETLARALGCPWFVDSWITPRDDGCPLPTAHGLRGDELERFLQARATTVKRRERRGGDAVCRVGLNAPVIGPYGDIFPCIQAKVSAGRTADGIGRVWAESELLQKLRGLKVADCQPCGECEHNEYCFWCPAVSYLENGRFDGPCRYSCEAAALRRRLGLVRDKDGAAA